MQHIMVHIKSQLSLQINDSDARMCHVTEIPEVLIGKPFRRRIN